MRRFVISLFVVLSVHLVMDAQTYNSVFPIANTVSNRPEFVAANVYSTQGYMGKTVYLADQIGLYDSNGIFRELESPVFGSFISFTYVTKSKAAYNGAWNSGAETTQMAFHPGGRGNHYGQNSMKEEPNYAFCFNEDNGLSLYDLNTLQKVAVLDTGSNIKQYASLTVFASSDYTMEDYIVIVGQQKFKIYGTLPDTNGVRAISYSGAEPSYFGINGQKYDEPQPGFNIVVNGNETKKVIIK